MEKEHTLHDLILRLCQSQHVVTKHFYNVLYQAVHSQPYDRLEGSNRCQVCCVSFYPFVVQCGAVISTQSGLQWTIIVVPEVVTKRFTIQLKSLCSFTQHAELFYCIITVVIPTYQTSHNTSAPTNSLVIKNILCCFVCVGKTEIFWKVLEGCCHPPPSLPSIQGSTCPLCALPLLN